MKTIKDLPEHSRPREKLREKGASALTDEELVAVILGLRVLDHVIVTRKGYFSFQEAGLIRS
jgi:DNA repair protein RadC